MDKKIFSVIDTLRFPLIVIVLYMHIIDIKPIPVTFNITGWNLYHFFIELVSHNLGLAVVPCFFLFSGFLFYYGTNNKTNNWFFTKLESRTRTIALPFLLWNIIFLVVSFLKVKVGLLLNLHNSSIEYNNFIKINKFDSLWADPIDLPLWYLRDLISTIIISPVLYLLLKKLKHWGILLVYLLYLLPSIVIPSSLISIPSIFFFGLGMYFAIYRENFYKLARKYTLLSGLLFISLAVVSTFYSTDQIVRNQLIRIFVPFGVIFLIGLSDWFYDNYHVISTKMISLSKTVFFIYAFHELYLKNWCKGLAYRLGLYDTYMGSFISYLLLPLFLLFICLLVYRMLLRFTPRLLSILTGGRF